MSAQASSPEAIGRPLALVVRLLDKLEERGVRYCHWKSTTTLDLALTGRTDLDLLVHRSDAVAFDEVTRELDFKPFVSHESRRYPGVEDLLGYDQESGRLVHLHVYYQLLLGQQYVKNHRLPLEDAMLSASVRRGPIRVPPPELEVVVLALRTLLKYRDADALKDRLRLGRRGGIPPETLRELEDLAARADRAAIDEVVRHHLQGFPLDIVPRLLDLVGDDSRNAALLLELRARAVDALRRYERLSAWEARRIYAAARLSRAWPLRTVIRGLSRRETRRKSPRVGGVGVALVGIDGAGKSTVIDAITEWLAWRVNVAVLYMGSARPSTTTRGLKLVARAARAFGRRVSLPGARRAADLLTAIRYLWDARDRRRRADEGRRLAGRGVLVLYDRYPLPGARLGERSIDGPRIRQLDGTAGSRLLRRLARLEERIHRRIAPPDCVILLRIPPDVARQRKAIPDPEGAARKARALETMDRSGLRLVEVDATQPLDAVVRDVKRAIWGLL
ncbi:MAG TPA: hypothetical protein VFH63_03345 [candidate division Zixibacteria bacterium]|nr:hypothetical protein [candidate division Zixibacteria bacterium]